MQAKHERLALRLTGILIQLNSGNRLSAKVLAEEYKVSLKTIKRDLDSRLIELPWKEQGPVFYQLNDNKMNNIGVDVIERFCRFAAVKELFPPIDHAFLDVLMNNHILVKGFKKANLPMWSKPFQAAKKFEKIIKKSMSKAPNNTVLSLMAWSIKMAFGTSLAWMLAKSALTALSRFPILRCWQTLLM